MHSCNCPLNTVFYYVSQVAIPPIASKPALANISQLNPKYHHMFHMLCKILTCLVKLTDYISKSTLASVIMCWVGEKDALELFWRNHSGQAVHTLAAESD